MKRTLLSCSALLLACALQGYAAEDPSSTTLPLRGALHEDATLEAPLTQLVDAYRKAQRLPELLNLYRVHLGQYPQDTGATIVLIRLLHATRDPAAAAAVRQAIADFPQSAYLQWLAFSVLNDARDPKAIDHLAKAIEMESVVWRREQWIERLMSEAIKLGRRELVDNYLTAAAEKETSAAGKLNIGRRQALAGLHDAALTTFTAALASEPSPEALVEIHVEAATSEVALNKATEAAQRLDNLLQLLGPDHWRRAEITRRRLELAGSEKERNDMIVAARQRMDANPNDDAAALDLARLLLAADRRRDALAVLTTATTGDRGSARLEQELFTLHERIHDPVALDAWLSQRLVAQPNRTDLILRRIRTLIDLGKGDEATTLRRQVAKSLPATDRHERLLALARELRRDSRHTEAAHILEELFAADPERIDLTRELSETWLAAGNRGRVDELLNRPIPATAAPEQVLDMVQFLMSIKQFAAANRAINERLTIDPGFFELRVQAIRLAGRIGDVQASEQAAEQTRALTDTVARYRLWLEATTDAAGEDRDVALLEKECHALAAVTEWTDTHIERMLACAEICVARDRADPAILLIDNALADARFPQERRASLRRQLVVLLENSSAYKDQLPGQLQLLANEDPTLATECRVRAALLDFDPTSQSRNPGATASKLTDVAIDQLNDPTLVTRLEVVFTEAGNSSASIACMKRLTELEPATAGHWERWLTALGKNGDENLLRTAIRRLLAGVDNLEISEDIRDQLATRLASSCWRSAAALAAQGHADDWQTVLALLEEADNSSTKEDTGWILVGRLLALHHLGRHEARDQIVAELEADKSLCLVFPDGLGTSLEALHHLIAQPIKQKPKPVSRALPPAPWDIAWSATFLQNIHGIWLDDQRAMVLLENGQIVAIDRATGARAWEIKPSSPPRTQERNPFTGYEISPRRSMYRPAVTKGRIIVSTNDGVTAYATSDGSLLWRCNIVQPDGVLAHDDIVFAWSDKTGQAIGIDPLAGRLHWNLTLPELSKQTNSGPSQAISGDLAVVLGKHAAVIDVRHGIIQWSFSDAKVADSQVSLTNKPVVVANNQPGYGYGGSGYGYRVRRRSAVYYQPSQQNDESATSWTTTFINHARNPWACVYAADSHLFVGDYSTTAVIPLALPLHNVQLPAGLILGIYGRRALMLSQTSAKVCSLDSGDILADFPFAEIVRKNKENALTQVQNPWVSGVVQGRLGWISGTGGVMTIDIERLEIIDQQMWDNEWSIVEDTINNWTLGGAIPANNENSNDQFSRERLAVGSATHGIVLLPVGSQRIVAIAEKQIPPPAPEARGNNVP